MHHVNQNLYSQQQVYLLFLYYLSLLLKDLPAEYVYSRTYFLHQLMKQIRENIKSGTIKEFRDQFVRDYYGNKE